MKRYCLSVLLLLWASIIPAQDDLSAAGDCERAFELRDSIFGPTPPPSGFGKVLEISDNDKESPYWFEQENNTIWYKFRAGSNGILRMKIIPEDTADDVDFLLFNDLRNGGCARIISGQVKPIRTNISRAVKDINGETGLWPTGEADFVRSGPGNPFSNPVPLTRGHWYYLVVNHYRESHGGHTIHLYLPGFDKEQQEKEQISASIGEESGLKLRISDERTGEPLQATVRINGIEPGKWKTYDRISSLAVKLPPYRSYRIEVSRPGFIYEDEKWITSGESEIIEKNIAMQPVQSGKRIILENIHFDGDQSEISNESDASLDKLVRFLRENPDIHIEIQGHVNARRNSRKARKLSRERAKSVYYYLILKEIPAERMSYRGYGNTQMIYKDADMEWKARINRRVEIRIL